MKAHANTEIYHELKRRIITMDYVPGDFLSEKKLIEEFKVSRTPIREAILKLAQDGLIDIRPRLGTYIAPIDLAAVRHAYEVKKTLEGLAAELACQRATETDIKNLYDIIHRLESYDLVRDFKICIQEDQAFHQIIRQASRNPILIESLDALNTKTARFLQSIRYIIDNREWFFKSLYEMADAIQTRNKEKARQTTEDHTKVFLEQMARGFFEQSL